MAELRSQVTTYITDYICDKCGLGEMSPTGVVTQDEPPEYVHACSSCGAEERFLVQYPYLTREKV